MNKPVTRKEGNKKGQRMDWREERMREKRKNEKGGRERR